MERPGVDDPDGLYGDVDEFMSWYEQGVFAREYARLMADNALDEHKIRVWMDSLNSVAHAHVA